MVTPHPAPRPAPMDPPWRRALGLAAHPGVRAAAAAVAVVAAAALVVRDPRGAWLVERIEAARGAGPAGALAYAALYLPAGLALFPMSLLTVGAGYALGPVLGILLAVPATCAGSCAPFLLARTAAHAPVARWLSRRPRLAALAEAVERRGFRVVLLLRLAPLVPFAFLNYALGVTPMRLRQFGAASLLGTLPSICAYAWLGSLLRSAREAAAGVGGGPAWAVAALACLSLGLTLASRRALLRALPPARIAGASARELDVQ